MMGDKLHKTAAGEEVTMEAAMEGKKVIGFYFSAHWCPPCRGFTPVLAEAYTKSLKDKGMEIIFCSSDRDEASFKEYFGEMPWLALPFSDRKRKEALSRKFKVSGIPTLVLVNAEDGTLITEDGRTKVMKDPEGANFPWIPKTFKEALGEKFTKGSATVGKEAIEGKTLGLYFSAHWCGPCRAFTPKLAKWYSDIKKELGDKFEIVFCSSDHSEISQMEYYKSHCDAGGDWLALPFDKKDDLDEIYKVNGIPTFIIVDAEGNVVNSNGRGIVGAPASQFPWKPPAIGSLEDPEGINDTPSMCLMLESCEPAVQERILKAVEPIAEKLRDSKEMIFFASKDPSSVSTQIRAMCGLESVTQVDKKGRTVEEERPSSVSSSRGPPKILRTMSSDTPTLILLDCPDNGAFYVGKMAKELDGSGVQAMIDGWKGKTLTRQQLSK